jgi:hypothetical protein
VELNTNGLAGILLEPLPRCLSPSSDPQRPSDSGESHPGNIGQTWSAFPHRVSTMSTFRSRNSFRCFDRFVEISRPISRMTWIALGWMYPAGCLRLRQGHRPRDAKLPRPSDCNRNSPCKELESKVFSVPQSSLLWSLLAPAARSRRTIELSQVPNPLRRQIAFSDYRPLTQRVKLV